MTKNPTPGVRGHVRPRPVVSAARVAPILVGVGGHPGSTLAVCWAAREAALRRRPARLVHARTEPYATVMASGMVAVPSSRYRRTTRGPLIDHATELVHTVDPATEVTRCARAASPARLLVDQAHAAPMVVLGSTGAGTPAEVLGGRIRDTVAARAPAP